MTGPVKNKALVERFNKYIDYKKTVERSGESFTERLAKKAENIGDEERGSDTNKKNIPLRGGRRFQPPRIGRAKSITNLQAQRIARLAPTIESAAKRHGVPVELICGVILQESGGNHRAVSSAGAQGLMQLMPGTAKRFGVTNSFDPVQNIEGGTKYLRFLLNKFDGNLSLAVAAYNAGEGNVQKYGNKIPPFAETRAYVPNVLGYTQSMIDIFYASLNRTSLPANARRV